MHAPVAVALVLGLVLHTSAMPAQNRSAIAANADGNVVGTWELVSTRITRDGVVLLEGAAPELRSLKVLNETHYSVVTRRTDQFVRAGTGRYTLSGNLYTETVELASTTPFSPGAVFTFRMRIDGDLWYLEGESGSTRVEEVWRRIK